MSVFSWSQTAASNASADASINWAEGQSPSSVNDSARAMMAALAKYRDDIAGAIATSGTSTAYTVASNSSFDTLAHLNGQIVAFTPHTTNGATVTLDVDSLGAKPLRWAPDVELQSGVLIEGTPYVALYNNSDSAFYLQGNGAGAPGLPIGASIDYWGSTAPSTAFVLAFGQAISRTTYATLFSLFSTTYGTGDGSTTFNIPDLRGRIVAGKDDMGGTAASRLTSSWFGTSAASLGATGGSESHTLVTTEIPSHNHGVTDPGHAHSISLIGSAGNTSTPAAGNTGSEPSATTGTATTGISINNAGGGGGHVNVQPTIIANKLIRVI